MSVQFSQIYIEWSTGQICTFLNPLKTVSSAAREILSPVARAAQCTELSALRDCDEMHQPSKQPHANNCLEVQATCMSYMKQKKLNCCLSKQSTAIT